MSEKNFNLLILLSLKSICSFKKCYIMKHKTILLLASLFVVGIACKQFDREFSVNTNIDYCEAQALRTLAIVPQKEVFLTRSMEMMLIGISPVPVHGLQVSGLVFFGIYMRIQRIICGKLQLKTILKRFFL